CHRHATAAHGAAGIVDKLLAQAVGPAAVVADRHHSTGGRVYRRLEKLVANAPFIGHAHARCRYGSARPTGAWHPGETEAGHFDDEPTLALVKIAGLDGAADRNRSIQAVQLQRRA